MGMDCLTFPPLFLCYASYPSTLEPVLVLLPTSLRQSIREQRPTPTEGGVEITVHIDVENVEIDGTTVRVYDCAGQVWHTQRGIQWPYNQCSSLGAITNHSSPVAIHYMKICFAEGFVGN